MATIEGSAVLHQKEDSPQNRPPIQIHPLTPEIETQWEEFVRAHPNGSFFHQVGWKKVMQATYGYQPRYFYSEREGRITGIAPSFLISNWMMGRCLMSLPFAVYGGVCAADAESEAALVAHLERISQEERAEYLEIRNRTGEILPGYHANPRYATFTLPLVSDTETLYKALPKDIRYMIRKGEKAGLTVKRGAGLLDQFYRLMTVNLRRLGTPAFPRALFENLLREYPSQVEVTVVYSGDKAVSGGMSFFFRNWIQPYYVGSLDEAKGLAANNFLWWEMMKLGAEKGCAIFDFGRSKKDSGNFDFKKKWNPQIDTLSYQVRLVRRKKVPNFSPTNSKFQMATNAWKKMPLGLTRALGPYLVRWFP
jgi:FemAB-related protein (PEP-CTERM system-associated)